MLPFSCTRSFASMIRNLKEIKNTQKAMWFFLSHLLTSAFHQFVKKNSKLHVWHNRSSIQKILQQLQILRSTQGGEKKYHTFAEIRDLRKREGLRSRIKGTKSNMITVVFIIPHSLPLKTADGKVSTSLNRAIVWKGWRNV